MRRRALLMGGKEKLPLIIRVDTRKTGATPSDTFRIPTTTSETYRYKVDWGDGVVTSGHTGDAEHTYLSRDVFDIKIYGRFPRMFFNNSGDRLKLLEVLDWGEIKYSTDQERAFHGCTNLTSIATDENGWYNGITNGSYMFYNNPLTSLPDGMTLGSLTTGIAMFYNNSLTTLPDGMMLGNLMTGTQMFQNNSLTSLPDGMTLSNVTLGGSMFANNSLTSLPDSMTLSSLTGGNVMFRDNSLTTLPDGMTLSSLTNGTQMFYGNSLTSLPTGMTLSNMTVGTNMFTNNSLTSLPTAMTLSSLTTGGGMFQNNSLTSLPTAMTLSSLTGGGSMFQSNPITSAIGLNLHKINNGSFFMSAANLPVSQYSNILVDIEANNPNNGITIHFGTSEYNATGQIARNILTSAPRNWVITDGGLE